MRLGLSTACNYGRMETEEMAAQMKGLGLSCCEVFLQAFSEFSADFAHIVKDALQGVSVHSVHPLGTVYENSFFSNSPRQARDALDMYERVLDAGQVLGAKVYVLHGPFVLAYGRQAMPLPRLLPVLERLIELAAVRGMMLGMENVSWAWLRTPEQVQTLRAALPALRFVLDVKQAVQSGQDPLALLSAMGGALANLHVCDVEASGTPRMVGQGCMDFRTLFRAALDAGYEGPVIFEPYPSLFDSVEDLKIGLSALQKDMDAAARIRYNREDETER